MKQFSKILSILMITMLLINQSSISYAATPIANTLFINNQSGGNIPSSGTREVTLNDNGTMFGYIIMPEDINKTSYVKVTISNDGISKQYTLIVDGKYHTQNISLKKGKCVFSWNGANNIYYISVTFGK